MVTAELAVAMPALLLVTVACVWALAVVAVHVRCLDAARTGARAVARGEEPALVRELAGESAPAGARVEVVSLGPDLVAVDVRARLPLLASWPGLGAVRVGGRFVAEPEEAVGADGMPP